MPDSDPATLTNEVAPEDVSGPVTDAEDTSAVAQAPSGQGTWQPDERYKGMQRELQKEKDRRRQLEAELEQVRQTAGQGGQVDQQITMALLSELARTDPDRARAIAQQIDYARTRNENEALRAQLAGRDAEERIRQIREANMAELREIARDFGADPDSPLIDYGSEDEPLFERMRKVRTSARNAVRPATPTPPREVSANATHNTQPGIPPAPTRNNESVTADQLTRLADEYARNPTRENLAKLIEAERALEASLA